MKTWEKKSTFPLNISIHFYFIREALSQVAGLNERYMDAIEKLQYVYYP